MRNVFFLFCLIASTCNATDLVLAQSSNRAKETIDAINNPQSNRVLIAAHRGGYANDVQDQSPENSLANITVAQKKGFHLYETDLQRTKDGVFVIVHDPTLNRETNGTGPANEKTLTQLKALRKKYRNGDISDHPVATFEEFLQHGKGRILFKVDMKPGINKYFKEIMDQVVKHDMLNSVIFRVPYSDLSTYIQYRENGHAYTKSLLMVKVATKDQLEEVKDKLDTRLVEVTIARNNPSESKTLELIRFSTQHGFLVETHSHGDEKDWAKLIDAGVRMFHTQTPSRLQSFLNKSQ